MADPHPNYSPAEADTHHRRTMTHATQHLLARLRDQHPRIVAHLTRKHNQPEQTT